MTEKEELGPWGTQAGGDAESRCGGRGGSRLTDKALGTQPREEALGCVPQKLLPGARPGAKHPASSLCWQGRPGPAAPGGS